MQRRELIKLLAGTATLRPLVARAQQQPTRTWRIGQVVGGTQDTMGHLANTLGQRLEDLGYVQGKNITLTNVFVPAEGKAIEDAIRSLLPKIDLLVVRGTIGGVIAKKMASPVPVVFLSVGAPVDIGLVESLAHPGGTMTGTTFEAATETYAKRLQILKEIVPTLQRVAVLKAQGDANVPFAMASLDKSAPAVGVTLTPIEIKTPDDLPAAFDAMQRSRTEGLIVIAGVLTYVNSKQIADLAIVHRLPSCHAFRETVVAGGLVSLGPDLIEMNRQGAAYIDKIIRGAKPADLPVEQPDRYEIFVNLKTAKALDLTVPSSLLIRADEVIE
jgi:putative tryptophan/tyrosine transport system substrate-binding protein